MFLLTEFHAPATALPRLRWAYQQACRAGDGSRDNVAAQHDGRDDKGTTWRHHPVKPGGQADSKDLAVYDLTPDEVELIRKNCPLFECYVTDKQVRWLVIESDHDQFIVCGP